MVDVNPTHRKRLTIKSGKVKRTTATSVFSFAPAIDDSNHSLINPDRRPTNIREPTAIVDFFKDNF